MKKKYLGATKKKAAQPMVIPWRKLGLLGSVLLIVMLAVYSYPYLKNWYVQRQQPIVLKPTAIEQPEPPIFEFYTELTKQEADEYNRRTKSLHSLKKNQPSSYTCYVQAGSFAHLTDAERTRAFLTLNGYSAVVRSVSLEDGKTRHRVILGPFTAINEAQDMQKNLQNFAGIQSILLKTA